MKNVYSGLLLAAVLFISGCGESTPDSVAPTDVEAPPSIAEKTKKSTYQHIILSDKQKEELQVETQNVTLNPVTFYQKIPATVFPSPDGISKVPAPINGRIQAIYRHEGEQVHQGDPLLTIISLELAGFISDYLTARSEVGYQKEQLDRLSGLVGEKITTEQMVAKTRAEYERARANLSAARSKLIAVGYQIDQLESTESTRDVEPIITLRAPISGIINQHLVDPGEAVQSNTLLLDIIEPEKVMVRGYMSASDKVYVQPGNKVTVELVNGSVHTKVNGVITSINPALDQQNKSAVLNVVLMNKQRMLTPGQTVEMNVESNLPDNQITVPTSSVVYDGDTPIVFVQTDTGRFLPVGVTVEQILEDVMVISDGLSAGDKVATTDAFSLKALMRFSESE